MKQKTPGKFHYRCNEPRQDETHSIISIIQLITDEYTFILLFIQLSIMNKFPILLFKQI